MKGSTILAVTRDAEWLVAMRPALSEAGRWRLVVSESIEEAGQLLDYAKPDMVLVDWRRRPTDVEDLTSLLWRNSIQKRQASIVVVAPDYQVSEATLLFQLGVDEYASQADHHNVLGVVLSAHTPAGAAPQAWGFDAPAKQDGSAVHQFAPARSR